ncbi:putative aTP-dependent DNA helicase [Bacteroides fragilis str. I1345]|nr:putative aTP-dependent DNA helicase [Bacteroides fragilis str. I1345]
MESQTFIRPKPDFSPRTPAFRTDEKNKYEKREKLSASPFYCILI